MFSYNPISQHKNRCLVVGVLFETVSMDIENVYETFAYIGLHCNIYSVICFIH